MDDDDGYGRDNTAPWLVGLIDGVTGATVLAAIAAVYALAAGALL